MLPGPQSLLPPVLLSASADPSQPVLLLQLFFQLCLHNAHGRHRRTQEGKEIGNKVAVLEIEHLGPAPGSRLGREAHGLMDQGLALPGDALMRGGEFQMVGLAGAGDAAPGQECPPQEGRLAAVLLRMGKRSE